MINLPFLVSPSGADPIVLEAEFAALPARVFRAWTTPDEIKKWFGAGEGGPSEAAVDLRVGGAWKFTFASKDGKTDSLGGRYLRIEKDRALEFSWVHARIADDGEIEESGESVVMVELSAYAGGTRVRLVHRGVASEDSRTNICTGWSMSLEKISKVVS